MGMEELKSLSAEVGLRRSCRLMKKARNDSAMVIDLEDDEIEEEEDWEPKFLAEVKARSVNTVSNPISFRPMFEKNIENTGLEKRNSTRDALLCTGIDLNAAPQAMEGEMKLSYDKKNEIARAMGIDLDDPIVLDAIMDDDIMDFSFDNFNLQRAEIIDLSSSESGDEGDGDNNGEFAEEQEEIVTTLSREDAVTFVEVMKAIEEGGDLRKFKMDQLKTYLRHHGLRMVGAKLVLLSRIKEHQRIKDRGQEIYPRSSFSINCRGDVCLGDSVLFLQTVYDMPFDYDRRCASGPPLGKRWVAGKVVSESYGAGKQQHTFTIEVFWSTGMQPFYCMRPVKIKGRNLYRMVTMRQPWSNEIDRQMVLDEKHARGTAARAIRRAVKGLKSKGKSRAESRLHPYSRPHGEESHGIPQETTRQNAGIHNGHQGSIPAHIAPTVPLRSSKQHESYTERTVYQTFAADNHPAPPTTPGRSSHTQQGEAHCNIKRNLEPTRPAHDYSPPMQHGRSFHIQQECQGSRYPAHNYPHPRQHGRSFHNQQKECQGNSNPAHNHPHPRQHGRSFHNQQKECEGHSNPALYQPPPRAHVQEYGKIHTPYQTSSQHLSNQDHYQQEATRIPCSNTKCENAGALRCIMRSCGQCCTRITNKGRCRRHN